VDPTASETGPNGLSVAPHWNVNLRIDDSDALAARVVELGGSVLIPPMDTPGFRSAVLLDPQGLCWRLGRPLLDRL